MSYFQGRDGSIELTTCSPKLGCPYAKHWLGRGPVYWAWDRQLASWVHYDG